MDSDGSCDNATTQTPAQLNLSTLADNGGETQTIALLAGSTAINHIPVEVNGCGSSINTDQRGVTRPVGSGCDVGAYEFQPCTGFSMTAANETDLNNAIACFNQEFTPEAVTTTTYTITLTADITLTAATEPIDSTTTGTVLIVAGNGFTVDGRGILGVRPFEIKTDTIVHMSDFTITGGHVSGFGGGILNDGNLTLTNMSVLSNTTGSSGGGGGIHNYSNGMMTIVNSTLSHNESETGGGINNAGTLTLNHVTMSGNIESGGGDGAALANFGTLTMANSIVANSINNNNCFDWGSYTSYGYNISDDASCHFLTATGDISGTNPLLAPLADNGGGTMTHALLANSPAINHIPPGVNGCGTTITNDQRGIVRPQNSGCDIGSYEVENTPPVAAADAYNTDEDTPLTVTAPGVLDNDNDVDSDPLTALLVNDVSSGPTSTVCRGWTATSRSPASTPCSSSLGWTRASVSGEA
jgi:hypothetical protein